MAAPTYDPKQCCITLDRTEFEWFHYEISDNRTMLHVLQVPTNMRSRSFLIAVVRTII
jgi:hypothetical protein